ncbi:alpha,alpha-phosphotrehalase [Nanchangia anserum]|uniref:Alpha,alpha-phosphotrehalase n=1 Tax=Nanchangia anserum TaxID=2692125 RepID=A0A8I0G6F6_9ACTO|nr:alpha,alpha-phosphotrehalase [Nanchangia anserum]MBD3688650.1 alpha,alpha-phosphotrehalase [Nanchangia anserum]
MPDFSSSVVYQIYPRSFADTTATGTGDLPGVIGKLDYLADLGVDYVWLTPVFPSPGIDNGYDVADYCAIDPQFGTLDDLDRLIAAGRERGIGVILDMVFNHTSTSHPWFRRALAGDPTYLDYYHFVEGSPTKPPTNWQSKFGGPAWEYVPKLKRWYLHLFDRTQADLNWDNPAVRREVAEVVRWWKRRGVAGFRFDVVNLISKPEHWISDDSGDGRRFYTDGPHVHDYIAELVDRAGIGEDLTVGEMSSTSLEECVRYSNPQSHELAMTFNFHHLKVDYADGDKWAVCAPDIPRLRELLSTWQQGMAAGGGCQALFWNNHDQPRALTRFDTTGGAYRDQIARMLAVVTFTMRGVPFIYQGDELGLPDPCYGSLSDYRDVESLNYARILRERGMSDDDILAVIQARSRDNGRVPVPWDDTATCGFSEATPWLAIPPSFRQLNAAAARRDPTSLWHLYRDLIRWRKRHRVLTEGDVRFLPVRDADVIAYERTHGTHRVVVVTSWCARQATGIDAAEVDDLSEITAWATAPLAAVTETVDLAPYQVRVFATASLHP